MKKRKGSLLIAVTLLSVVLLIIMMTIFNLNKKNAELTTYQSDREKAFQVAYIGLEKATENIETNIQKDLNEKKIKTVTWEYLYNLKTNTQITGKPLENKDFYEDGEYKYSFKYNKGQITSIGTYKKSKVTLTANYAMDYMGLSSNGINYIKAKTPVASLKSVYSYKTQYPMQTWINKDQSDDRSSEEEIPSGVEIPLPNDRIMTYYDLLNNDNPLYSEAISNHYIIYDKDIVTNYNDDEEEIIPSQNNEEENPNNNSATENKIEDALIEAVTQEALNKIDQNTNNMIAKDYQNTSSIISANGRKYIAELVKSINIESNSSNNVYIANKIINFNVKQSIRNLDLNPVKTVLLDTYNFFKNLFHKEGEEDPTITSLIGENCAEIKANNGQLKQLNDLGGGMYEIKSSHLINISEQPFQYDYSKGNLINTGGIKNIYLFKGRNVVAIPLNSTLVINGDILLAPNGNNDEIDNFYGFSKDGANNGEPHKNFDSTSLTEKEINNNYPVLLVTGNLVVNGTIRGNGTVFSMNNITINAIPSNDVKLKSIDSININKYTNYFGNTNLEKGAIILHACNQLYIHNEYSLNCLANNTKRQEIIDSWALTQDRTLLEKIGNQPDLLDTKKATENVISKGDKNKKTPTAQLQLTNKLPVGVPNKGYTGNQGLPAKKNTPNFINYNPKT